MTVVLVHGNPETDAIWGPLVDAPRSGRCGAAVTTGIRRPAARRLSRRPISPTATGSKASWSALTNLVDLVGHDWGGGHLMNVIMHRPGTGAQLGQRRRRVVRPRLCVA